MQPHNSPSPPPRRRPTPPLIIAATITLTLTLLSTHFLRPSPKPPSLQQQPASQSPFLLSAAQTFTGPSYAFALPPAPTGILLLLHGCGHSHTDFFPSSPPKNPALPEESRLVTLALSRHYAALAISSPDRASGCWRAAPPDIARIAAGLAAASAGVASTVAQRNVVVFGASAGGRLAAALPRHLAVAGVIAQIASMAPPPANFSSYPPTAFVHMPRDARTAAAVGRDVEALRGAGVRAREFRVGSQPFTERFCRERLAFTSVQCGRLVGGLRKAGVLGESYSVVANPRNRDWVDAARVVAAEVGDGLEMDKSGISEVLNVAYASHELTADGVGAALDWIEAMQQGKQRLVG